MATAQQLVDAVDRVVDDSRYDEDTILGFLNQGLLEIAGWNNSVPELGPVGKILLPALETNDTVTTSTSVPYVAMPANYMRDLYAVVYDGLLEPVAIVTGLRSLHEAYGPALNNSGEIEAVTIVAGNFYYQPIPTTATESTIYYYRLPDTMLIGDSPICLPIELQMQLLLNYAAGEIYNEIEKGLESDKINTKIYRGQFYGAMHRLFKTIGHKSKQSVSIRRTSRFF